MIGLNNNNDIFWSIQLTLGRPFPEFRNVLIGREFCSEGEPEKKGLPLLPFPRTPALRVTHTVTHTYNIQQSHTYKVSHTHSHTNNIYLHS